MLGTGMTLSVTIFWNVSNLLYDHFCSSLYSLVTSDYQLVSYFLMLVRTVGYELKLFDWRYSYTGVNSDFPNLIEWIC